MNVAELQNLIEKIKAQRTMDDDSTQSMDLFIQMSRTLDELEPESELTHKTLDASVLKITDTLYEELTKNKIC